MKTIHHVVDVAAPAATVWRTLTEHDGMAGWWSREVTTPAAAVGARVEWTFTGDFNPVMEITALAPEQELQWRCVDGHAPWADSTFRFALEPRADDQTRLRFWQQYATELSDDAYGIYNFNWGYYLESLRRLCTTGAGQPFRPPN